MKRFTCQYLAYLALACAVCLHSGCSTRLARENVFANTETLFGISIAQNPTTQLYEARIGYARHELFYVPTSKLVTYKSEGGSLLEDATSAKLHHDPTGTPEVLAEIEVGGRGSSNGTRSFNIRQRLAVGKEAVRSGAAVALMADDAEMAASAAMIQRAIRPSPQVQSNLDALDALLEEHQRLDPAVVFEGERYTSGSDLLDAIVERDHNDTIDNIRSRADAATIQQLIRAFEQAVAQRGDSD